MRSIGDLENLKQEIPIKRKMENLPLETFVEILRKTNGITLGKCRRVCSKWKNCIDGTDFLWQEFCETDFRQSSRLAKIKSGNNCQWYHIYKNLVMWSQISSSNRNLKEFYKFSLNDISHCLGIDYCTLPLRDSQGVVLYDMSNFKYIPVALAEQSCRKIANNDFVTVVQLKSKILVERTVENNSYQNEAVFKADDFVLTKETLYFCSNRDVFKCDLVNENLSPIKILQCQFVIKEMEYNNRLYIFTECGKIVTVYESNNISVKPLSCPAEWIKQIKHISAFDDKNFVCYSRNLFKIETDKYEHLYLDFPPITALFFYGDVVLIGTKSGEILLYRLSSQKRATMPIFENLAVLPDGKFPVQLDVCERKTGPVIVVATFFEIYFLDCKFFPHEEEAQKSFPAYKLLMYKRLLKLRDRIKLGQNGNIERSM